MACRPKVTELFAALMGGGSEPALASVQACGVLARALDLVLRYPFNNLLHLQARPRLRVVLGLKSGTEEDCLLKEPAAAVTWAGNMAMGRVPYLWTQRS